jgi:hypothetical protein
MLHRPASSAAATFSSAADNLSQPLLRQCCILSLPGECSFCFYEINE